MFCGQFEIIYFPKPEILFGGEMGIKIDVDDQHQQNHPQLRTIDLDGRYEYVFTFSERLHGIVLSFGSGNSGLEVPAYSGLKKLTLMWGM